MHSRNIIIIGIVTLLILIGAGFIYFESKNNHVEDTYLPAPNSIPGIYVPEEILKHATSTSDLFDKELVLYTLGEDSDSGHQMVALHSVNGDVYWKNVKDSFVEIFDENDSQILTLKVRKSPRGITLVDAKTGQVWRREPAYSFTYHENGKDRRLTLYEAPSCDARVCDGEVQGVFEEKDKTGRFELHNISTTTDASFSYGRLNVDTTDTKVLVIGVGKSALVSSFGDMHQGREFSGEWLLEYDNFTLATIGSFILGESNEMNCDESAKNDDRNFLDSLCYNSTGTSTVDKLTTNGYYDIIIERSGTELSYTKDDKEMSTPVAPLVRYQFKNGSYQLK